MKKIFIFLFVAMLSVSLFSSTVSAKEQKQLRADYKNYSENLILSFDQSRELSDMAHKFRQSIYKKDKSIWVNELGNVTSIGSDLMETIFGRSIPYVSSFYGVFDFILNSSYREWLDLADRGEEATFNAYEQFKYLREEMDIDLIDVEFHFLDHYFYRNGSREQVKYIQGGGTIDRLHLRARGWISRGDAYYLLKLNKMQREQYLNKIFTK